MAPRATPVRSMSNNHSCHEGVASGPACTPAHALRSAESYTHDMPQENLAREQYCMKLRRPAAMFPTVINNGGAI